VAGKKGTYQIKSEKRRYIMMDKDFVKLNEEELKDVVGGIMPDKKLEFLKIDTFEFAMEYLKKECYIGPGHKDFTALMKEWAAKHS
jgi:hypothetical protein